MTEFDVNPDQGANERAAPESAGAILRAAREAAGLTVDAVAQQLKLAPRQVQAIEDGAYTLLPGRTFVRGFVRNYARLVRLDPETVLDALPAAAPTLESPALQPTSPSIGELPTVVHGKPGWTRWAIPTTLVAIIAAAAIYEWMRPGADARRGTGARETAAATASAEAKVQPSEVIGTPLPNPVATAPATIVPPATPEPAAVPVTAPMPVAGTAPSPGEPATASQSAAPHSTSAVAATPAVPEPSATPATAAAAPPREASAFAVPPAAAPLTLAFRDFSWTEVKDRQGHVLLSRMNPGGTTQGITGAPPFDLVIGNASNVTLTWKGRQVDLAPHTRQNVARLTLQ